MRVHKYYTIIPETIIRSKLKHEYYKQFADKRPYATRIGIRVLPHLMLLIVNIIPSLDYSRRLKIR